MDVAVRELEDTGIRGELESSLAVALDAALDIDIDIVATRLFESLYRGKAQRW